MFTFIILCLMNGPKTVDEWLPMVVSYQLLEIEKKLLGYICKYTWLLWKRSVN